MNILKDKLKGTPDDQQKEYFDVATKLLSRKFKIEVLVDGKKKEKITCYSGILSDAIKDIILYMARFHLLYKGYRGESTQKPSALELTSESLTKNKIIADSKLLKQAALRYSPRKNDLPIVLAYAFVELVTHSVTSGIVVKKPDLLKIYTYLGYYLALSNRFPKKFYPISDPYVCNNRDGKSFIYWAYIEQLITIAEEVGCCDYEPMLKGALPDFTVRGLYKIYPTCPEDAYSANHPRFRFTEDWSSYCTNLKNLMVLSIENHSSHYYETSSHKNIEKLNSFGYAGLLAVMLGIKKNRVAETAYCLLSQEAL